jgi:hypothetical protein
MTLSQLIVKDDVRRDEAASPADLPDGKPVNRFYTENPASKRDASSEARSPS